MHSFCKRLREGWTCGRDVLFCSQEHHLQWWQGREITVLSLALHPGSSPSIHISFLGLLNPDNNAWNYLPHLLCCARSISSFKNFFKAKSFWLPALTPLFSAKEQGRRRVVGECWVAEDRKITGWPGSHPDWNWPNPAKKKKRFTDWKEDVQNRPEVGGTIALPLPVSAKTGGS